MATFYNLGIQFIDIYIIELLIIRKVSFFLVINKNIFENLGVLK